MQVKYNYDGLFKRVSATIIIMLKLNFPFTRNFFRGACRIITQQYISYRIVEQTWCLVFIFWYHYPLDSALIIEDIKFVASTSSISFSFVSSSCNDAVQIDLYANNNCLSLMSNNICYLTKSTALTFEIFIMYYYSTKLRIAIPNK